MTEIDLPTVDRLTRDLRSATATLSDEEARFLVDAYYIIQEDRKRSGNQVLSMKAEPHALLAWFFAQNKTLEQQLKGALERYAQSKQIGQWMMSTYGVGPVIAAGLMAHINIKQCPTVGHIWRFAGLDPSRGWLGREGAAKVLQEQLDPTRKRGAPVSDAELARVCNAINTHPSRILKLMTDRETGRIVRTRAKLAAALAKRPWNASLKTLCWHIGQSFMKFSNQEECTYGHLYRQKKEEYAAKNERGEYAQTAAQLLPKFNPSTEAHEHLSEGKLPPAQIDARARRWTVKLYLSHVQAVWWEMETGTPPAKPYILTEEGGHAHEIRPPNWK